MIPKGSNFPERFDTERNLYTVRDSLNVTLARDYSPGDPAVLVEGDISQFPNNGVITLIDQVSEPNERAVSLHYDRKTQDAFWGLSVMEDSKDVFKPKKLTSVTMQLRAEHHNSIKDAIIAIQTFLGLRKTVDKSPFGPTLMGRANFLINMIHQPKAWFEIDKTVGLAPFNVEFTSKSSGVNGPVGDVTYQWDFGDSITQATSDKTIWHTYLEPGTYDVTLTVTNAYGEDTVTLHQLVKVRVEAPQEATIQMIPQIGQVLIPGEPELGPYTTPPVLRTPVGQLVNLEIAMGENPVNQNVSYAGEILDPVTKKPMDAITSYSWGLGDDLPHGNSPTTQAAYSLGGLHDLNLRVDTQFGSYRITCYENCIDAVEIRNLWLWMNQGINTTRAYEFGLNNETFKTRKTVPLSMMRDDSFLNDVPNSKKQKKEFLRNAGFAPVSDQPSGHQGQSLLFWATGRNRDESPSMEEIHFTEYNAFTDTYEDTVGAISRPWNWASLVSTNTIFFILGNALRHPPSMSLTNNARTEMDLQSKSVKEFGFDGYNYINGAHEVQHNGTEFDSSGNTTQGHLSCYRTAWHGDVGYLLRGVWQNDYFYLRNFYKTDGTIMYPFVSLVKLVDVPSGGLKEGQLAVLSSGVYLFSNMGAALSYRDETGTWEVAGGGNPGLFRMLQDSSVMGYDNDANTLLVASDGERKAFLSFDYSPKAFIKFNEADFSFSTLGSRPAGDQWQIGVY